MLWVIDTVRERGESACGAAGGDHIQVLATTTSQVDEDSICSTSL